MIKYFRYNKPWMSPRPYIRCSPAITDLSIQCDVIALDCSRIERWVGAIPNEYFNSDYTELDFAQLPSEVREIWKDDLVDLEDEYEGKYLVS